MPKLAGIELRRITSPEQAASTSGTLTLSVPGAQQTNDIMFACMTHNSATAATAHADWTLAISGNNGTSVWSEIWWRRVDGTEVATYDFTFSGTIARGSIITYIGCKRAGSPIGASSFKANSTGASTGIHNGLTTTADNSMLFALIGALGSNSIGNCRPGTPSVQSGTSVNWTTLPPDSSIQRFSDGTNVSFTGSGLAFMCSQVMKRTAGSTGSLNTALGSITGTNVVCIIEVLEENDEAYDTSGTKYYATFEQPSPFMFWPAVGTWDQSRGSPRCFAGGDVDNMGLTQRKSYCGVLRTVQVSTNQDEVDVLMYRCISNPLEAQTIDGTFDMVMRCGVDQNDFGADPTNPVPHAWLRVHIYVISDDEAGTVRGTLLDNYTSTNMWGTSVFGRSLGAQTLTPVNVEEGDRLVIEWGYHLETESPYPTPTRVPTLWALSSFAIGTQANAGNFGATSSCSVPNLDAVALNGETDRPGYFEFSDTILELDQTYSPPANDSQNDAIAVTSFPYDSGELDTHGMTDPYRRLWWHITIPEDGNYIFHSFGSTVDISFQMASANPASGLGYQTGLLEASRNRVLTSINALVKTCTAGEQFYIATNHVYNNSNAFPSDGGVRVRMVKQLPLANNDVIVGSHGYIARFTEDGDLAALTVSFVGSPISGLALDYTQRPMADFNSDDWPALDNTDIRLYLGLYGTDIVEIIDAETLNPGTAEIDYISDPLGTGSIHPDVNTNMSSLAMTPEGILTVGYFGDGFIYVAGSLASYMTAASESPYAQLNTLDASHADSQPDAPFAQAQFDEVDLQTGGTNYIEYGQTETDSNILYYTSGGWYRPVGGDTIYRFDMGTRTQLTPFATGLTGSGPNPGVKGIFPLPLTPTTPDGGMLVCNGSIVQRLNAAGAVVATYTPSPAKYCKSLADVELQADGRYFWCWDEATSSLFKFDMETGLQVMGPADNDNLWTQMSYGSSTSIALVRLDEFPPPDGGSGGGDGDVSTISQNNWKIYRFDLKARMEQTS